jgi:hypothetical protein
MPDPMSGDCGNQKLFTPKLRPEGRSRACWFKWVLLSATLVVSFLLVMGVIENIQDTADLIS